MELLFLLVDGETNRMMHSDVVKTGRKQRVESQDAVTKGVLELHDSILYHSDGKILKLLSSNLSC
uniref:Uncharacterized protein n=1 Tax=Strigamia maritima TaxID=126957 RepID=T1J3Y2_STRMM